MGLGQRPERFKHIADNQKIGRRRVHPFRHPFHHKRTHSRSKQIGHIAVAVVIRGTQSKNNVDSGSTSERLSVSADSIMRSGHDGPAAPSTAAICARVCPVMTSEHIGHTELPSGATCGEIFQQAGFQRIGKSPCVARAYLIMPEQLHTKPHGHTDIAA